MITFVDRTISINSVSVQLEHPIADAFELGGRVIVLFNPDAHTDRAGQFNNLVALLPDGQREWTAELPTTTSGDRYYRVASRAPLVAYSIYSEECELDPATGRIRTRKFFK